MPIPTTHAKANGNHIKHQLLVNHQMSLRKFSETYDFKYAAVSDVVRGINLGNYGTGKLIREKLEELIGDLEPQDQKAA